MKLAKLITSLDAEVFGDSDVEVRAISYDSRAAAEGAMFVALEGEHADGANFIEEAAKRGAVSILAARRTPGTGGLVEVIVDDVRGAFARVSDVFYHEPSRGLKMVGITGTNGKTTVAYLVESMLERAGLDVGVIGTINYRYGGRTLPAPYTTPQPPELHGVLADMVGSGVTHCVMEVSSHALAQRRADWCRFDVKVFTNLSREHLDYHRTMDEYFSAKARLFRDPALDSGKGVSVINVDDRRGAELAKENSGAIRYGLYKDSGVDIFPEEFLLTADGIKGRVSTALGVLSFSSPLVGEYNLYNILAAIGAAVALGVDMGAISKGIEALPGVAGRLERFDVGGVRAYVDYAHTSDALENVLLEINRISGGSVITVFGCGGDRDATKRAPMGEIAARLSTITIITTDNPRDEDPGGIIKDIEAGMKGVERLDADAGSGVRGYMVIPDREEAIKKALSMAKNGDTVLVAGKGHEDYQIVKSQRLHFDDREILRAAARAYAVN